MEEIIMFCKYCKIYHESEERTKFGNYCFVTHKVKEGKEEACKDFTINHFFYCIALQRRQDMVVCMHIQKKLREGSEKHKILYPDCQKCNQKNEILDLHRGIRADKPILIKRTEKVVPKPVIEEKKPVLIPKQGSKLIPKKKKPILIKRGG
jgi:hypothetical protein